MCCSCLVIRDIICVSVLSRSHDVPFRSCVLFVQSVKILTYREPQNAEYKNFVENLKLDAKRMFNYTIDDSLVSVDTHVRTNKNSRSAPR